MQMTNNTVKYEVFVKQYLRAILGVCGRIYSTYTNYLTKPRLPKYSKNYEISCHITHDKMAFSEVLLSHWCLFLGNLKPLFK